MYVYSLADCETRKNSCHILLQNSLPAKKHTIFNTTLPTGKSTREQK